MPDKNLVKTPDTAKTTALCNIGDRPSGVCQQALGVQQPLGLRVLLW
jgi:hypothetical protein